MTTGSLTVLDAGHAFDRAGELRCNRDHVAIGVAAGRIVGRVLVAQRVLVLRDVYLRDVDLVRPDVRATFVVTAGAIVVVAQRTCGVIREAVRCRCREVRAVVARRARVTREARLPVVAVRTTLMTRRAVLHGLRERHVGIVVVVPRVPHDVIGRAGLHARQILAAVDLVDHLLEVDAVPRLGILHALRMAGDAQAEIAPASAVNCERVVAVIAGLRRHDLARLGDRVAVRPEMEDRVRSVLIVLERARRVRGQGVRLGLVVALR